MPLHKFIKIDKELEEKIRVSAELIALETKGVSSLPSKGIVIERSGDGIELNVSINVEYGQRIPEVAWDTQANVMKAVSEVTDIKIKKVNVNIQGVE